MGAMKALYTELQEDARMEAAAALVRSELGGIDWDALPEDLADAYGDPVPVDMWVTT